MPIGKDVKIGKNTIIYHRNLVNLYGCKIGNDCVIGAFVEIRKEVKIGNKVKIQAHVFIPEGVTISDEVFIGPGVTFTNDLYPRATNIDGSLKKASDWKQISTKINKRASIGANSTIICGVTIGKNALIGAGSVVTKDIPANQVWVGNPARFIKKIKDL
ncbi:acetyltransferase [Candidatus Woesebacteria bacterium RIFCSPHIGHO2_02_FULL_39_13]|uniref:Acetyltransferase n=1 Tax=Candidatus Woesebacteria bacterium RIFCSPHIGHO2_02_FULL_39_13 TaxID=1802505 RepID=A0A1F7YZX9_9BACT|nr:MAG: acetyltransferase [Candidatus Woesebacteria bacterium RIFCSPHIGHO2_01_FULL_39_95]OGM32892.1 MAG: acetyltransferase [Candidatus Woesebacteria bacterium RIFCSPHIGHO2_02_FULL_39_13]OGM74405.1 MAG: acetyltransferase [Candidatus Woesebacteria bacterium RIFCSPLOWO2_12_FULL_39_9]